MGPDGTQRVTPADNARGLPLPSQSQPTCDSFTQQKERALGDLCADPAGGNASSFFWTAMLKSGAMNASERGRLCGLWCANKTPDCNGGAAAALLDAGGVVGDAPPWADSNYVMRQPRVLQEWTAPDGAGGWRGSFYGTLDEQANLTSLPTPAALIAAALGPKRPGSLLAGLWLGQGDARLAIAVAQAPESTAFTASCTWSPAAGLPQPWINQTGSIDDHSAVLFHVNNHTDAGFALGGGGGGGGGGPAVLVTSFLVVPRSGVRGRRRGALRAAATGAKQCV